MNRLIRTSRIFNCTRRLFACSGKAALTPKTTDKALHGVQLLRTLLYPSSNIQRLTSSSTVVASFTRVVTVAFAIVALLSSFIYLYTPTARVQAATNSTINFQARILSNTGAVVPDGYYNAEFKLYTVATAGSDVWTETWYDANGVTAGQDNRIQIKNGYLTASLGSLTSFANTIPWDQELWLSMNIGGVTQTATPTWDGEMAPRMKVTAVPYAFRAAEATQLKTINGANVGTLNILAPTGGNQVFQIQDQGAGGTFNLCIQNSSNCGFALLSGPNTFTAANTFSAAGVALAVTNNATIGGTLSVTGLTTATGGLTVGTGSSFINQGSTVFSAMAISDVAGGGNIGTAAATVDVATTFNVAQTTAGQTLTLPNPTSNTAGRMAFVNNTGSASFTMYGSVVASGKSNAFIWNGANWVTTVSLSGSVVNTIGTIDSVTKSADGASIGTNAIYLQTADATYAGLVSIGTQTFAGDKTFTGNLSVQNVTLAAGKSLTVTGGNTASRPASPTEGMVYFDTDTKQLLTYANGKWQQDRTDAVLVAASNSSQSDKDVADYVADGNTGAANDGDQVQINSALTAAAGKKVVLLAGTYIADETILVPNNTILSGVGRYSVIEFADLDNIDNLIENSDTTTGTGVGIRDLRLNGRRDLNTSGAHDGIYMNGLGGTTGDPVRTGGIFTNLEVDNFSNTGIRLNNSANNVVSNSFFQNNGSPGIYLTSTTNTVITGNTTQGNELSGITIGSSSNDNIISNNKVNKNNVYGIRVVSSSSNNLISGNTFNDNGSLTTNAAVSLSAADNNRIVENIVTDTSCTTTCYAVNISDSTSDNNYMASNTFSSTPGTSSINDAGTGTVFANQPMAENGMNLLNRTLNSTNAFSIQGSNKVNVFNIDSTNGEVEIGSYNSGTNPVAGKLVVANANNANTITLLSVATPGSNRTIYLPDEDGTLCIQGSTACGFAPTTTNGYVQLAPAAAQADATTNSSIYINKTGVSGNILQLQKAGTDVFTVSNTGTVLIKNSANSTTAFRVQRQTADNVILVDAGNNLVKIGNDSAGSSSDTTLFIVDSGITANQPTGFNGGMFYDTTINKIRCYENSAWKDCDTGVTTVGSLDGGTANATGATITNSTIYLQSASATNPGLINTGSQSFAGVKTFTGQSSIFQNGTDNTDAFMVKNQSGTTLLNVNTATGVVTAGNVSSTAAFRVTASNTMPILTVDTTNAIVQLGSSNSFQGQLSFASSTNSYLATLRAKNTLGANVTFELPDVAAGTYDVCTSANNCTNLSAYIQNQNGSQQATSNYWISGTGRADTSLISPILDTATNVPLNIGTTNATTLNIGRWGYATSIGGSLTANYGVYLGDTATLDMLNLGVTTLKLGTVNATGVDIGSASINTIVKGNLTTDGNLTVNGGSVTIPVTNAGTSFVTPQGSSVVTRINVPLSNPGNFNQILAMGLPNGASTSSRAISLFDNRAAANNQPVLAVFSPNENNVLGFGWDGQNTNGYLKAFGAGIGFKVGASGSEVLNLDGTTGAALFKNATDSATAFQIQDSGAASLFTANTLTRTGVVAGNMLKVGNSTGTDVDTTLLVLDGATAAPTTNLASLNGALFYNTTTNKVSAVENGAVVEVCTTGAVCAGYTATPATGSYIQQVPTATADNTITPTTNSVVGLTVNGTSGTAATALAVSQPGAAAGITVTSTNNTATNGLSFSGTFTNYISAPNFSVANTGALTAVGVNSGTGLVQGTGGLTITGTTNINATGAGTTTIGSAAAGTIGIQSSGAVNTTAGAASTISTTAGALTLTSAAAATWSTTAGNLTIQAGSGTVSLGTSTALTATGALGITSGGANGLTLDTGGAATLSVGTTNANALSISRTGITTTVNGVLTVAENTNLNGNTTIGNATTDRLTVTSQILGGSPLVFQGATDNGFAITFAITEPTANNTITLPDASGTVQLAPATGSYIQQVPTATADNTITPTTNSVVGLTVNGTSGTAATALAVSQPGAAAGITVTSTNNTATNGLSFSGTFTNYISAPNLTVTNAGNADFAGTLTAGTGDAFQVSTAGAVTAVGVNSGTGLLQGTGGLTITGATSINASGANATNIGTGTNTGTISIGNTSAGALTLQSGASVTITGAAASSFTTTTGNLTLDAAAVLNLGNTTATAVNLGRTGITTTNAGALTVSQLLTGNLGATVSGAAISLNDNSNFNTTINTGTSTGAVTIGNNSNVNNAVTIVAGTTGGINLNSGTITSNAATLNLFNSPTTINALQAGTTISLGATTGTLTVRNANQVFGNAAGSGQFTNNGATLNSTLAVANDADGGVLGGGLTAAASVDVYTSISVAQTTASQTITLPTPTANTSYGRIVYLSNIGNTSFTFGTTTINPGTTATLIWSNTNGGASWQFAGADGSGILNQNTADQSANFRITGTGRANTSFTSPLFDSITGALSVGTSTATGVTIGGTTNTTAISLQGAVAATYDIGTATGTGIITLGKSTAAQTVNILSANATTGVQAVNIANGTTGANTTVSILSGVGTAGVGTLNLGNNTRVTTIAIGNIAPAAARTTTIAGGNSAFVDTVNIGTGNATVAGGKTINIGNGTPTGTNIITIGSIAATANTTTIQGGNGAGAISIQAAASGTISLGSVNNNNIAINTAAVAGTTTIGGTGTTGTITVGQSTAASAINIGSANATTGAQSINIANGTTGAATTVNILSGTGTASTASLLMANNPRVTQIDLGNVAAAAARTINLGTGNNIVGIDTINIGSGNTTIAGGKTINIGTGTPSGVGTNVITIGTTATAASSVTLAAGSSGYVNFNATQAQFSEVTGTRVLTVQTRTTNVAGSNLTLQAGNAGAGGAAFAGGTLTLQGGAAAGTGNANGGNIVVAAGAGVGTGLSGIVQISNPVYNTATEVACAVDCNITQANISNNGAVIVSASAVGLDITLQDPTLTNAGRVVYITAANGSQDFTLRANVGGGVGLEQNIAMRQNTTATMIWNGTDWTAAGASSSTTLQAAYDNTLTAAGGAEIILNNTASANGLTVRNNATSPIIGGIFEAQTSIGSNLFSVNNNATEFATNGGAETAGGSTTTFPANTWDATTGGTVERYITTGDNVATGAASVRIQTTAANHGARNRISTTLTTGLTYSVSFAVRGATNFSTLDVRYSPDGSTTGTTTCSTAEVVTSGIWTRINCTFIASGTITANNSMLIRQTDGTARTFYIDNLSVNINASATYAADGSVDNAGAFGTNWTAYGAGSVAARDTGVIYDSSASARVDTTNNADRGIRNNLSIFPAINTQYLVSFYARSGTGTINDLTVRYSRDGGTNFASCVDYNTQAINTTGWTKITCLFTTDGTAASNPDLLITQNTAPGGTRSIYIDALSMTLNTNNANNVQIGGANKGGPTTLFTLDRSDSAPIAANNDAYLGSMYYDTTSGRIQCYEADGWGACGSAPDNIVNLNPEYSGAVLNGTGVGTMTADLCADQSGVLQVNAALCDGTGNPAVKATNFYKWTSPQASQQTYSIYVSYQLPTTFKGFASDDTVQLTSRVDSTTNAAVTYEMFRSEGGTLYRCGTGETSVTTVANTWQTVGINGNESTGCGFTSNSGGAYVIFKINVKANSNASAYVSTLSFTTTGK